MPDGVLPALVRCPVVGVVLGDVGVDPGQGELLVTGVGDGLHDQLGVRERRLGLILGQKTISYFEYNSMLRRSKR